jgi:hypothetical protein
MSPARNLFGELALDATVRELIDTFDGSKHLGYITDLVRQAAEEGRVYIGGSGRLQLNEAANVRGLLLNPVDSECTIQIIRMSFF